MIIKLSEPDGPYSATIDTEVMEVEITRAFIGPEIIGEDNEHLVVVQRDSGFEVNYSAPGGPPLEWNAPTIAMKEGRIIVGGNVVWSAHDDGDPDEVEHLVNADYT